MILTGSEIVDRVHADEIVIEPFSIENVNPNSYNFALSDELRLYEGGIIDVKYEQPSYVVRIPDNGYVLEPQRLYLASTVEKMGSTKFVPTFSARSSVARLGMFINLSASLGDIGFIGHWTLQLFTVNRIRVYPGMLIGQMMFWHVQGVIELYKGKYQGARGALPSQIFRDFNQSPPSGPTQELDWDCVSIAQRGAI